MIASTLYSSFLRQIHVRFYFSFLISCQGKSRQKKHTAQCDFTPRDARRNRVKGLVSQYINLSRSPSLPWLICSPLDGGFLVLRMHRFGHNSLRIHKYSISTMTAVWKPRKCSDEAPNEHRPLFFPSLVLHHVWRGLVLHLGVNSVPSGKINMAAQTRYSRIPFAWSRPPILTTFALATQIEANANIFFFHF